MLKKQRLHREFYGEHSIATLFLMFENTVINVWIVVIEMHLLLFMYLILAFYYKSSPSGKTLTSCIPCRHIKVPQALLHGPA